MTKANANVKVNSVITFSAIATMVDRVVLMLEYLSIGIIYNFFLGILFIFSCMFFMSWAVMGKRKTYVVWGSLLLFLHRLLICILGSISGFGQVISLCLSAVILISMCFVKKRKKPLAALSFIVMAIITVCGLFPSVINIINMGGDGTYVVLSVCLSAISYLSTATFYGAFGIYVLIDGKPTARTTVLQKKQGCKNDADLLEEQLNAAKAMFESGIITAEEYEKRRKNILSRSAGVD